MLVNKDVPDEHYRSYGHFVIVGMSEPAKFNPSDESWWYAIILRYPGDNKLEIRSHWGVKGQQKLGGIWQKPLFVIAGE